ncbi:PQQ-dependent sugar dehydrogenase [Actinoplanes sp. NPDC051411]|uniref:PQQ-dependent sugar dehydrogenase n=1 Tax=Actinoplanes sp. NPDC051411 TaxID=3155522 RepID=UPI0034193D6A
MSVRNRRFRAVAVVLGAVLALTTACAFGPPGPDEEGEPPNLPPPSAPSLGPDSSDGDQEVVVTVLAKHLAIPSGIAFLPDGSALVTERDTGRILQVGPDSDANGLTVAEARRLNETQPSGDGGLLGIAVSPKYASDKTIFVYYSTAKDNRVAKMTLKGKLQPILTGIPRSEAADGGALAFGPDGFLYVGTGDGTPAGTQAPNAKNLGGKILRMTTAGKPAPGNPVKTSLVWASGFHNVQGLAWDKNKKMYASDNGQPKNGELNVVDKGRNYGWPKADGPGSDAKLTNPLLSWPSADSTCVGVATMEQSVATACLTGKRIWLAGVTANGTVLGNPQPLLVGQYGRLRALVGAPDGSIWASTSNQEEGATPGPDDDRLIRLVFSDGGAGRS